MSDAPVIHPLADVHRGASIGARTRVWQYCVVLDGAVIGAGALVQDAIIGARAQVGAQAVVDGGAVLGDDVVVGDGDEVHGGRIPGEG